MHKIVNDYYPLLALALIIGLVVATINLSLIDNDVRKAKDMSGPVFIAHGCEGAGGDLWATDISDFPTSCKEIERAVQ